MSQSVLDPVVDRERDRLESIALLTDPATIRHLEALGVADGWACAEVGAGAGSIARWLSTRVGYSGKVVAVDINTEYLRDLRSPNLEIREQDITTTPLEEGSYDLIHAKILLMHLPEREKVLHQFVAALKPGGVLLVEEADIRSIQTCAPPNPLLTRAANALSTFFYFSGADPGYGLQLLSAVRRTNLTNVGTDCQLTAVQAGTPQMQTISLSLAKLAPMIVQVGLMSRDEIERAFEILEQPSDFTIYTPITVSVWGRRVNDQHG